ncbi:hypothetical protein EON66_04860 [archaeon]|nr:MAG: hypothetical protein EON66_04860 [archaeon]
MGFAGVDPIKCAADWEVKRNTLLELLDFADGAGRQLFADARVLEDTFTMVRVLRVVCVHTRTPALVCHASVSRACVPRTCVATLQLRMNLFRPLVEAPAPSGDPDEGEIVFTDPEWSHLNIIYELLLRLVRGTAPPLARMRVL